jgi:hypothetical protein
MEFPIDYLLKVTLGITGLPAMRDHIELQIWHLDVDSTSPPGAKSWNGSAVRRLKGYVSWV